MLVDHVYIIQDISIQSNIESIKQKILDLSLVKTNEQISFSFICQNSLYEKLYFYINQNLLKNNQQMSFYEFNYSMNIYNILMQSKINDDQHILLIKHLDKINFDKKLIVNIKKIYPMDYDIVFIDFKKNNELDINNAKKINSLFYDIDKLQLLEDFNAVCLNSIGIQHIIDGIDQCFNTPFSYMIFNKKIYENPIIKRACLIK